MDRYRLICAVSASQLVCGGGGVALAVRHRYAYDLLWLHGRRDKVARDALLIGTAVSAPAPMLIAQGILTAAVARQPSRLASRGLGALGAAMVPGYLLERHVRRRLTRSGWDPLESSLILGGLLLAAAMAALGLQAGRETP